MQAYAETASKAVAEAENALRTLLEIKEPQFEGFEPLLDRLRKHAQDYVFLLSPSPAAKSVQDRLWDSHVRVNKRFQKHLKYFREGIGKKKHVERRKAEKSYLGFIKSSMHFYRGYIQRLASHFSNVPEIATIAAKLHLDALSVDHPVTVDPGQKGLVLASCHSALMRLGDLSRYRETELETKNRNWGPAKGHYQLALSVKPESGAAYNQLAVMALADDDHLRAVYYLHRAATTSKPFPVAQDNINLEFEKLLKLEPEEKSAVADTSKQTLEVLENRFLAFHANCHSRPSDFVTYSDKATQMLQLITVSFEEIRDRSLDKLLQKMCLISIAAEHLAWKGVSNIPPSQELVQEKPSKSKSSGNGKVEDKLQVEHERNCQAVYLLQRFNILTFTILLKILSRELASEHEETEKVNDASLHVSLPVRRLLPQLRQYSSWLLSNVHALLGPRHASTAKCLEQFWKAYAAAANSLLTRYHIAEIRDVDYLLDEDEDTLSFAPFTPNVMAWRYHFDNGSCKPVHAAKGKEDLTNGEMLARIRRFVFDAATITNQKDKLNIAWAPIALVSGEFTYNDHKPAAIIIEKPSTPSQPFRSRAHAHASSMNGITPVPSPKPAPATVDTHDDNPAVTVGVPSPQRAKENLQPVAVNNMVASMVSPPRAKENSHVTTADNLLAGMASHEPEMKSASVREPTTQSTQFNSSSIAIGTPGGNKSLVNIMDIVRGMQQSSKPAQPTQAAQPAQPDIMDFVREMQQRSADSLSSAQSSMPGYQARLSNPALPGIWSTAFTPRPGEASGSSPRPGSASAQSSLVTHQSSAPFHQAMMDQEHDIRMRTSPFQAAPMSSWQESQHSPSHRRQQYWQPGVGSPWHSPASQPVEPQERQLPHAALFGVIGQPRSSDPRGPREG